VTEVIGLVRDVHVVFGYSHWQTINTGIVYQNVQPEIENLGIKKTFIPFF